MGSIDSKIINLLRHDARTSISDIAIELGISRATVRSHIEQLQKRKVIIGYTVVLSADALEQPVRGIMMIEIKEHNADRVIKALGGFAEISTIHTTNGRFDLIVELATATLPEFDAVLHRIRLVPGITATETHLLLATPRSTRTYL